VSELDDDPLSSCGREAEEVPELAGLPTTIVASPAGSVTYEEDPEPLVLPLDDASTKEIKEKKGPLCEEVVMVITQQERTKTNKNKKEKEEEKATDED
jgi:hypothetical protein